MSCLMRRLGLEIATICALQHEIIVLCSMWIQYQSDRFGGEKRTFRTRETAKMLISIFLIDIISI